jgi:hypothetical protein
LTAESALPELAGVYWRRRVDERGLSRTGRLWTVVTCAHTVPLVGVAVALAALAPVTVPVGLILLAHAWIIPELYAARGANVLRRRAPACGDAERRALGLLADLLGHDARALHPRTGVVLERGRHGVWIVGEAGALLVRPGGRRVHCYCVRATDPALPPSDRIAHLLLALREDEAGFLTVANLAFAGACWRLRRRVDVSGRAALDAAVRLARGPHGAPV